jgi:hypothetical protein
VQQLSREVLRLRYAGGLTGGLHGQIITVKERLDMQCEFSKAELIMLDFALMDRGIGAKIALSEERGNKEHLEAKIKEIDALHDKLLKLIRKIQHQEGTEIGFDGRER